MHAIARATTLALVTLLLACGDGWGGPGEVDEAVLPVCEARQETALVERAHDWELTSIGRYGWRIEPVVDTRAGLLIGLSDLDGEAPGRVVQWIEDDDSEVLLGEFPAGRRITALTAGPGAIYLLTMPLYPDLEPEIERAVLVLRGGATEVLFTRPDLRAAPPLLYAANALFTQIESGELMRIPIDGSPPEVFSPPAARVAITGDSLYLLRVVTVGDGIPYFRVDRQDLKTGLAEPYSEALCTGPGDDTEDPGLLVWHAGAPWFNTRAAIATVDDDGARVDHVLSSSIRFRGLRSADDGLYFWSGTRQDDGHGFYRLRIDGGPPEAVARLDQYGDEVTGWGMTETAHYIAIDSGGGGVVWRVAR